MTTTHRIIAVLKLPTHVPDIIKVAKAIVTAMTNNPYFPAPTPALALMASHIADLETAETAAKGRAKGTVPVRNAKLKIVVSDLHALKAHVQLIADGDMDNAVSIIQSAGLNVRKDTVRTKGDLSVQRSRGRTPATSASPRGCARTGVLRLPKLYGSEDVDEPAVDASGRYPGPWAHARDDLLLSPPQAHQGGARRLGAEREPPRPLTGATPRKKHRFTRDITGAASLPC